MNILEYDDVDPAGVLDLDLLSLDYPLTPDLAARIRRLDRRPFPFFGLYAVEEGIVAGQVAVYRLPAVTIEGPEDVGGITAVATHPAFSHRGIAARLMEEAHARMRSAGLRFSTLATSRHRLAYLLYRRLGYEDVHAFGSAFTGFDGRPPSGYLTAEPASPDSLPILDELFRRVAAGRLGFARRYEPFFPIIPQLGDVKANQIWLISEEGAPAGYSIASFSEPILRVSDLLLEDGLDPASAVAAIAHAVEARYIQAGINHSTQEASYRRAGYRIAQPAWGTFMLKPLLPDLSITAVRQIFGMDTELFLISLLDVT